MKLAWVAVARYPSQQLVAVLTLQPNQKGMKRLLLLLVATSMGSCEPHSSHEAIAEAQYQQALTAAGLASPHDTVAFGLRLGQDSAAVATRLDSLCRLLEPEKFDTSTVGKVMLLDTIKPLTPAQQARLYLARPCPEPAYLNGKLVGLTLNFTNDNLADPAHRQTYGLLARQLARWYGRPGYAHLEGDMPVHNIAGYTCHSWFRDGMEIHLSPGVGLQQGWGAILTYEDVRRYPVAVRRMLGI